MSKSIRDDTIGFRNTQKKIPIDKAEVIKQVKLIKDILQVSEFHVDIWFCTESKIRELNYEHRHVRKSTDILSFPANNFLKPEVFEEDPSMEFDKHLGCI
jgi:ssRNA-specific RNase YbeY (16S rRNA maturation enzyme)